MVLVTLAEKDANQSFFSIPVACVPTSGVLEVPSCRAMTFTVYSVPGCRP